MSIPVTRKYPFPRKILQDWPPPGIKHYYQTGERWESIATQYGVNVKSLIYHNFKTTRPDEVNFYLHKLLGLNHSTDGINYAFKKGEGFGYIIIPGREVNFAPLTIEADFDPNANRNYKNVYLERAFRNADDVDKTLETVSGVTDATLAALTFVIPTALGAMAGFVAFWMGMGAAEQGALNAMIKEERLSGLSRGIVLGVDRRKADYVKRHFLDLATRHHRDHVVAKKLEYEYKNALIVGYQEGLNVPIQARPDFFETLIARMRPHPSLTYGEDQSQWSTRSYVDFYIQCAAKLRLVYNH
jgi:hypothetical protein